MPTMTRESFPLPAAASAARDNRRTNDRGRRDEPDHDPDEPIPPGRRPPRPVKEPPPLPEDDPEPPIEDPRPDKPKKM